MRVIGGAFRGLKLVEFEGRDIRPTSDRVKESLFNILSARVAGARCLDLFCGSGNLGIECLSRGAEEVVFNDISPDSIKVLQKNLKKLKNCGKISVMNRDYSAALSGLTGKFDLIFIDPPYALEAGAEAVKLIAKYGLLSDGGAIIYERDREFAGEIERLTVCDRRKYGKTFLTFFTTEQL